MLDLVRPGIIIGNLASRGLAEFAPLAWRQTLHRLSELPDLPPAAERLNQHAAPRRQVIPWTAPVQGNHRQSQRHRLQHHRSAAFKHARIQKHIALRKQSGTFLASYPSVE